jgi:glutathione S-transferase
MASKIELYSLATPNGVKVSIALEEMGIEYNPHTVNISKNEQFAPEVSAISPSSRIPVITDPNGPDGKPINIFESGAILLYLAEKSGKFLSPDPRLKWETIQWLFFQMAGVGPMFAQVGSMSTRSLLPFHLLIHSLCVVPSLIFVVPIHCTRSIIREAATDVVDNS